MFFVITSLINAAAGFLAVLPFMIIIEIAGRKQIPALSLKHMIGDGVLCFFLSAVLSVTGIPGLFELQLHISVNFIPFADIAGNTLQYLENVILFLPLGLLLPFLFPYFQKLRRCVLYGLLFSLAVECMQLFSFRATDIDDLLMNTLGATVGYGIFALICKLYPPAAREFTLPEKCLEERPCLKLEAGLLTAAAWGGALLLTPLIKSLIWEIFL